MKAGVFAHQNKRRGVRVVGARAQEIGVVTADEKTNEEEAEDVETELRWENAS